MVNCRVDKCNLWVIPHNTDDQMDDNVLLTRSGWRCRLYNSNFQSVPGLKHVNPNIVNVRDPGGEVTIESDTTRTESWSM